MCINPITITRTHPLIGTKTYTVPCGKCSECTQKKQSEFKALALHEALSAGALSFFTLTYTNESLPIAMTQDTPEGVPQIIGWVNDPDHFSYFGCQNGVLTTGPSSDIHYCASLRREDVKLWLKQFRRECERRFGLKPDLRYAIFGEYGEKRGRPHYHGLFFGLDSKQFQLLKELWQNRFGFVYAAPSPDHHLTLEEVKKISSYVSKYISKGICSRWTHILPYVEKPRRQSSLNFGNFTVQELSQLGSFMMAATYPFIEENDFLPLMSWLSSRLDGLLSL